MRYREVKPNQALQQFVECFWTLEDEPGEKNVGPEPILPDGCVELILNCGDRFRETREDGSRENQPAHFVVGQMTQPILIAPTGKVRLLGIRFQPGGTIPFLKLPVSELCNQIVELDSLESTLHSELVDASTRSASLKDNIKVIETCLTRRVYNFAGDDSLLNLTASVVRCRGIVKINQLASSAGISGRQLERRFLQQVGIAPKMFCRILRFQEVFRAVAENSTGWADVAIDCGYFDQAHLIRDFQEFAHQTPAALLANSKHLTDAFTRRNRGV